MPQHYPKPKRIKALPIRRKKTSANRPSKPAMIGGGISKTGNVKGSVSRKSKVCL